MNYIKKNWSKIILLSYSIFVPISLLYAQGQNPNCAEGTICNPIPSVDSVPELIRIFLEGALKIGIPVVALAVIYSGFLFVAARGNPEKLNKAKDALLYTLIGAAILLGSWAIAELISATVVELGAP
jgi:hypothetical protein